MATAATRERILRLLWVDGTTGSQPDGLARIFAPHCQIQQTAIAKIPWHSPPQAWEAICFDFEQPSLASLARVAKARQLWPRTPLILIVSKCSCALALWALRLGVFDVLTKPLTAEEPARCIGRIRDRLSTGLAPAPAPQRPALAATSTSALTPTNTPGHGRIDSKPTLTPSSRLQRAKDYIELNYTRPLPQSEVASACDMSPAWFSREFRGAFGANFLEYLTHYRIAHAKRLLRADDRCVADISLAVGFNDPSYFTRVFRRMVGISPTQYRDLWNPHFNNDAISSRIAAADSTQTRLRQLAL